MSNVNNGLLIHWIVEGVSGSEEHGYTSALASNRYRAILPAQGLRSAGHTVRLIDASRWRWQREDLPDALVIGKLLPSSSEPDFRRLSEHVLAQAEQAQKDGVVVVADFNDDHFQHPLLGPHWQRAAGLARLCVVGSEAMGATLRRYADRPTQTVADPVGSPRREPRVFRKAAGVAKWLTGALPGQSPRRLKFAWYGNPVNWPAMQRWADQLAELGSEQPWILWVVTRPLPAIEAFIAEFNRRHAPSALLELVPWDEESQWAVVNDADIVLIPSNPDDPKKAVKTSNRLTDALHAGRYVIASALPAYQPYAEFVALTEAPLEAAQDYLTRPDAALRAIVQGQGAAIAKCSPQAIAESWHQAFTAAGARASSADRAISDSASLTSMPVRLNLGCGDKILPGFVNVDLSDNWSGKEPDVIADVTGALPFPDHYADEVHAYHVLEHLLRWKVEDCLREWSRVLKPGGQLILEMPCLDKILGIYSEYAKRGETPPPRLSLWALYGDPGYRAEPMMHRWCYSVAELTSLLKGLGMSNVREEEPRTHIKMRDMRLVCEKS